MSEFAPIPQDLSVEAIGVSYAGRPVTEYLNPVEVTQKLVQIPSHESERNIGLWIAGFVAEHGPSGFNSYRIPSEDPNKETLIVANSDKPDLIALTHIDNVGPWVVGNEEGQGKYDPFGGVIDGGNLYGLGSADQKAGSAAMLTALASFKGREQELPKLMLAFTGDEEGDFAGINALAQHFKKIQAEDPSYKPSFVLTTGSDGEIGYQCRGVAELEMVLRGETGHAAVKTPGTKETVNAFQLGFKAVETVAEELKAREATTLGVTTYNMAAGTAGLVVPIEGGTEVRQNRGNRVPDYLKIRAEFRPNGDSIDGQKIDEPTIAGLIKEEAEKRGLRIEDHTQIFDLPAWLGDQQESQWLVDIIKRTTGVSEVPIWNAAQHGYEEGAILFDALSKGGKSIPAAIFGYGKSSVFHKPDEHVEVEKIPMHHDVLVEAFRHPQFKKK